MHGRHLAVPAQRRVHRRIPLHEESIWLIQSDPTLVEEYATLPHSAMNTGRPPLFAAKRTVSVNSDAGLTGGVRPLPKLRWAALAVRQPPVL